MSDGYGPLGEMKPVDDDTSKVATTAAVPAAATSSPQSDAGTTSSTSTAATNSTVSRKDQFAQKQAAAKDSASMAKAAAMNKASDMAASAKPTKKQQQAMAASAQQHSSQAQAFLQQNEKLINAASPGLFGKMMGAASVLGVGAEMAQGKIEQQPDDVEVEAPEFDLDGNPLSEEEKRKYVQENKAYAEKLARLERISGNTQKQGEETMVSAQAGFGFSNVAKTPEEIEAERLAREEEKKKQEEEAAAQAREEQMNEAKGAFDVAAGLYSAWAGGGATATPTQPAATTSTVGTGEAASRGKPAGNTRGGPQPSKIQEPDDEEEGFIPTIPLPRHLVEKGSAPPEVVQQVAKQTMRGDELTVSETKAQQMEEEAEAKAAAEPSPMMAMVQKFLPFLGLQMESQFGNLMNTDVMIRVKCDDGVQLMAKATRDMNIGELKEFIIKTYCEKQFGSFDDAPEEYKIVSFNDEQGFEMVDSFRVTDVLKSGDVVQVCIVPANAGGDETRVTRPGIHPVSLDFSNVGYARYIGTPDVDPPFPGFYIGFDLVKNSLSAFVKSVQNPRANESHPPLLILGGVKSGKTTTLRTLLPSFVYSSDRLRRTRFLLLDCSNMATGAAGQSEGSASAVLRDFFFLLRGAIADAFHGDLLEGTMAAALSASTTDANVYKEASFDIFRALNRRAHKTIILIDELQQLFQVSANAAPEIGVFLKSILSHPMLVNVRFAVASTTTPAFLHCLHYMPSNGSDVLRSAIKLILPSAMPLDLCSKSREALVALHHIPEQMARVMFDPRLHATAAQHSAVASAYLLQMTTDPDASTLEHASAAIDYVHEQIQSVLYRDMDWLYRGDPASIQLWRDLIKGEVAGANRSQPWIPLLVRLGLLSRRPGGKVQYHDPLLSYFLSTHKGEKGKLVASTTGVSYSVHRGLELLAREQATLSQMQYSEQTSMHHHALEVTGTVLSTSLYDAFASPSVTEHQLEYARAFTHEIMALPCNKSLRAEYLDGKSGDEKPWFYALGLALANAYTAATTNAQQESLYNAIAANLEAHSVLVFAMVYASGPKPIPVTDKSDEVSTNTAKTETTLTSSGTPVSLPSLSGTVATTTDDGKTDDSTESRSK